MNISHSLYLQYTRRGYRFCNISSFIVLLKQISHIQVYIMHSLLNTAQEDGEILDSRGVQKGAGHVQVPP